MYSILPEQAGISAVAIEEYIGVLESAGLATHNLLLARGDGIFYQGYWKPFHKDFLHRMYSVSKNFVSIAVGFCLQDGLFRLEDRIAEYFPDEVARNPVGAYRHQTIRDMLMMSTERPGNFWFDYPVTDRTAFYFFNDDIQRKAPGALFQYDSSGSCVLGTLVERLTGMPFMEYLRKKLFDRIGVSKEAYCLRCPGGHSWADSAVLCTPMDLLLTARFVLNMGSWEGEQLLEADYLRTATSKLIDNNLLNRPTVDGQGYGYLFWRTWDNSFFFNGMGCQFAVCVPDKDLIMVYNGDNQNDAGCKNVVIENFFRLIARPMGQPLPENEAANARLDALSEGLQLSVARGEPESSVQSRISGRKYILMENPMGIRWCRFTFGGGECLWEYENAQGAKQLRFGMGKNVYGKFPQEGYAAEVAHVVTKGHYYDCAASAGWVEPHKLFLMVQVIDRYFGRLHCVCSFLGETVSLQMVKFAEDFMEEYQGFAEGFSVTASDTLAEEVRHCIRSTADSISVTRTRYYVSEQGDDAADGLSEKTPWRSLSRVNAADLQPGDGVFFRRGDLFRGHIRAKTGVTYAAYGVGEKPRIYGGERNLADPALWELYDAGHSLWKCRIPQPDVGTLVCNEGAFHGRKLIPSYRNGFVCREDTARPFRPEQEMTEDLDIFCRFDGRMTTLPSKGEDFPVPDMTGDAMGELFFRSNRGNPGSVFSSIEPLARGHLIKVEDADNVRIDNLCLRYTGEHAISAGGRCVKNLRVSNCEIGWVGGCIQHYLGTDPNYPQGGRGTVTRYGNGVEIYGGCDGHTVDNCYIYQIYDAGITHQFTCTDEPCTMQHIRYRDNLVEHCVYSIEYFLEPLPGDGVSRMEDVEIDHNILRFSGCGWGQQRHNTDTPAHIKGWSFVNPAANYRIHDNLFDRAAYRMLHIMAAEEQSLPVMEGNVYRQYRKGQLGQFGAKALREPENQPFDGNTIRRIAAFEPHYGEIIQEDVDAEGN